MLRLAKSELRAAIMQAAPTLSNVVWEPIPVSQPALPFASIGLLRLDTVRGDRYMAQPVSATFTVGAASNGTLFQISLNGHRFTATHDGTASTTATALRATLANWYPTYTIGGSGADVTVDDPAFGLKIVKAVYGPISVVTADAGLPRLFHDYTRVMTCQIDVLTAADPWESSAPTLAASIHARLDSREDRVGLREQNIDIRVESPPTLVPYYPPGESGPLLRATMDVRVWYTEAVPAHDETIDTASGTALGASWATEPVP